MTRLFFRWTRNFFESFVRWLFSMTKMRSAHSIHSGVSGSSASWFMPAEATSMPRYDENVFSAVGLRRRFWPQIKRMRFISICQPWSEQREEEEEEIRGCGGSLL